MSKNAGILAKETDARNIKAIEKAFAEKRIDAATRDHLCMLYRDGMGMFQNCFYLLGRTLDVPETPVYSYDLETNTPSEKRVEIYEIGPQKSFIVHHCFGPDPLRNQFFTFDGTDVSPFVSSIVSVIVAAQKDVTRSLDKVTGKYYDEYIAKITLAVEGILTRHKKGASVAAIVGKIKAAFRAAYISNPAPEVLRIIGNIFPDISVDIVRELDKIFPPFMRLKDVYRMKLLFDTVPQINRFIEHVTNTVGEKSVILIKNKFYNLAHTRNYRDAKIVVGLEFGGDIIPVEMMCNVRTFFNAERKSHAMYEVVRRAAAADKREICAMHHAGIVEYNRIICNAVKYLLHRVGWNMMYEKDLKIDSLFRGFPDITTLPYPQKMVDAILEKIASGVHNEIFHLAYAPRKLSHWEEISVFNYITRFILFAALPYSFRYDEIRNIGFSGKIFNFVMKELYRYYENSAPQFTPPRQT